MNLSLVQRLAASAFVFMSLGAAASVAPSSFSVEVTGHGKPIILIPGLASSGEVWKGTVAHFCGRHECHVLTLAGFAGVAPIQAPLLASVEKDLVAYIASNHLERPALVGHSLGGVVALQLAADHPESVGRVVVVDSLPALGATQVPDVTPEQLKSMADRMRDAMRAQDAEAFAANQRRAITSMASNAGDRERILGWSRASDRDTVTEAMHDVMATDLRGDLARIKAPTLVLGTWIAFKEYVPRSAIEATYQSQYAKLPGVRIEIADTARHFIMYDDPQWMLQRMDEFLE
jgi:pimeloyl-ACP methyl ester carboxylesterase